jgi:hypothetical protein
MVMAGYRQGSADKDAVDNLDDGGHKTFKEDG